MTPVEQLLAAAELLELGIWRQGTYGNENYGYCVVGALCRVAGETMGAMTAGERCLESFLNLQHGHVVSWNDDYNRTKEQVLEAMRAAAAKGCGENGGKEVSGTEPERSS